MSGVDVVLAVIKNLLDSQDETQVNENDRLTLLQLMKDGKSDAIFRIQKCINSLHSILYQAETKSEPMMQDPIHRLCLEPIQKPALFELYKKQLAKFWTFDEIVYAEDAKSFSEMNADEQHAIKLVLAFFANSDNAVMKNIACRYYRDIEWPEIQLCLTAQAFFEAIHVVTYNNMISAIIKDSEERTRLFQAVKHHPIIAKKIAWIQKWANNDAIPLRQCFIAQCLAEGVGFSPSFAFMLWLRKGQKCPGICFGNEKIIEDEALHVKQFGAFSDECEYIIPVSVVHEMCQEIVELEHEFVEQVLPKNLKGLSQAHMKQYVKHVADVVLGDILRVPRLYNVGNPLDFMEGIGLIGKTNFFEKNVGEYMKVTDESLIHSIQLCDLGNEI